MTSYNLRSGVHSQDIGSRFSVAFMFSHGGFSSG